MTDDRRTMTDDGRRKTLTLPKFQTLAELNNLRPEVINLQHIILNYTIKSFVYYLPVYNLSI